MNPILGAEPEARIQCRDLWRDGLQGDPVREREAGLEEASGQRCELWSLVLRQRQPLCPGSVSSPCLWVTLDLGVGTANTTDQGSPQRKRQL